MEKRLVTEAERLLNSRHQNKRRTQVIRGLALLVVLATISALMLPAITMSNEVECGMEEHIHSENCYAVQQVAPQPMLICTEGQFGEMLLHVHDSFCYDSQGNLICTLQEMEAHTHGPECYQERRALICTETSDPGHQHEASCYSYVKVENAAISMDMMAPTATNEYVCGMQEGEGAHQHTDNCYPKERTQRLICAEQESDEDVTDEEGNVLIPAHRHNSGCYEVQETPVFERFICTQEESDDEYDSDGSLIRQGHRHDGGCWLRGDELCYQEGCHQHESSGHQHTGACVQAAPQESIRVDGQGEQWEQTLVCQEPEREPGHIHTDACYEITQMLACQKAELEAHTHGASCEDENGALICGKTEISAHQHTDACFTVPEGGSEEAEVLICGMDEHTHTDLCYVKTQPETEKFYCGMEEHVHTTECEFPSGALKCTIPEHYHIDTCLAPPVEESEEPGESPGPEESQLPEDIVEVKDAEFVYHENPAFVVTFKVNGFARVAGDQPEQLPQDGGPVFSGEELTEIIDQAAPLAAMPRMMSMMALVDDMPSSGPDLESTFTPAATTDETDSTTAPGSDTEPEGTAVENSSHPILPAFSEPVPEISFAPVFSAVPEESVEPIFSMPVESAEPSQDVPEAPVEFYVEELGEDDPRYQAVMNAEAGGEDAILQQVIALNAAWNGRKLDLSECTITAVIKPTQALIEAVQSEAGIMSTVEDGAAPDGGEDPTGQAITALNVYTVNGWESAMPLDGEGAEQAESEITLLSEDGTMGVTVNKEVDPDFTVRYVSQLSTVETDISGRKDIESGEYAAVDKVIDTSGGKRPVNRNKNLPVRTMYVNKGTGEVLMRTDRQEVYKSRKFNYSTAKKLENIDIVTLKGLTEEGDLPDNHYELAGAQVRYVDESSSTGFTDWTVKMGVDNLQLTNRDKTAENDPNFLYLEDGCEVELIYETKTATKTETARFYDYDVSDGKVYTTEADARKKKNGLSTTQQETVEQDGKTSYIQVGKQGINSTQNADGTRRYAFGNSSGVLPTGWGDVDLNKANGNNFENCTFGIVSGMKDGDVDYSEGITGPKLFAGEAFGKTLVKNVDSLTFNRVGDTHTLTSAGSGKTASGLEKFQLMEAWAPAGQPRPIRYYNSFWPMDMAETWGAEGHDIKFGENTKQNNRVGVGIGDNKALAVTDAEGPDHNSYYGMTFQLNFDLPNDYVGPLEYYFFGDDDMWVFLDGQLVCDIGGVHSAVGEYVNLWDYIPAEEKELKESKEPKDCTSGNAEESNSYSHTLTFFYVERGASGSTCWMQYTLPSVTSSTYTTPKDKTTLHLKKVVEGVDSGKQFNFEITLTDKDGKPLADLVNAKVYKKATNGAWEQVNTTLDTEGTITAGLFNGQSYIITGLPVDTRYTIQEVDYGVFVPGFKVETHQESENGALIGKAVEPGTGKNMVSGQLDVGGSYVVATCTNKATYELPSTGGPGVWYTMACVPLAALFCLMYKKKSQREGDGG